MAEPGRPTKLNQTVDTRPDGTPITTAQKVVEGIRLGLDQTTACDHAGISRVTFHNWRLQAARHRAAQTQGNLPNPTTKQRQLIEFLNNIEKAYAQAESDRLKIIEGAAKDGHRTKTVIRVMPDGTEEKTTTTESVPQWQAAAWLLERTRPAKYGKRLELTGADGAPLVPPAQQAKDLAESLAEFQAGVEAGRQVEQSKTNGES
jgi:hypothetical protein